MKDLIWRCDDCLETFLESEMKEGKHPFREEPLYGCTSCGNIDGFSNLCDEPNCTNEATCGFPSPEGYRRTCSKHSKI